MRDHLHKPGALVTERHVNGSPEYDYACATDGCDLVLTRTKEVASW